MDALAAEPAPKKGIVGKITGMLFGSKMKMMISGGVLVLLLAGGGAAYYFLFMGKPDEAKWYHQTIIEWPRDGLMSRQGAFGQDHGLLS